MDNYSGKSRFSVHQLIARAVSDCEMRLKNAVLVHMLHFEQIAVLHLGFILLHRFAVLM